MKLATFRVDAPTGPTKRVGVVADETVIDVTATFERILEQEGEPSPGALARTVAPPRMIDFLERGDRALEAARQARQHFGDADGSDDPGTGGARLAYGLEEVTLRAPVPRPQSIRDYSTFEGHRAHFDDGDIPDLWYEEPMFTRRNHLNVVHPGEPVARPAYTEEFDFELEIGAVVGRRARNVGVDEADEYVAGYTIYNDFSARDVQRRERELDKHGRGKNPLNGFGPVLVTRDALDVDDLSVALRVNGEELLAGSTGPMQHTFPEIVAHLSASETLYPGEILASGTVAGGSGAEQGLSIEPDDVVELAVEGIGVLENRIVEP